MPVRSVGVATVPDSLSSGSRWRGMATRVAAVALLLAFCFALDEPVYRWVRENYNETTRPVPDHLKLTTRILRSMEDWGENVYIAAVMVAIWRIDRRRRSRIVAIILAAALVSLAVEGVKRVAGRERPEVSGGRTVFHGPRHWRSGGDAQSFPSGHAASAAAYSSALAACYPPLRPVCLALAVGCAGNRIWKERHFLSDCVASLFLGYAAAAAVFRSRALNRLFSWLDSRWSPREGGAGSSAALIPIAVPAISNACVRIGRFPAR